MTVKKLVSWSVLVLFSWGGMVQPALSESEHNELVVRYHNGLKMMTKDKQFKFQVGGRIMMDFAIFDADNTFKTSFAEGDQTSGAELRRARIFMAGLLYNKILFRAEYDFASTSDSTGSNSSSGEEPGFRDVYIELIKLPLVGAFRVGHHKEFWSLENMTSSKYIMFMERSLMNFFSPARGLGVGIFSPALDRRITWSTGVFFDSAGTAPPVSNFDNSPGAVNFSLRLTGRPWYQDKGKQLIHLGFSYGLEDQGRDNLTHFRARPEANLTSFHPVDTGDQPAKNINRYTFELAGVYGPFSLQGEYTFVSVSKPAGTPDADHSGFYVQASYFITGEHRHYNTKYGIFGRVQPHRFFDGEGGWGAWEVALRYSNIDLNDGNPTGPFNGGEMDDITFGVNWYLNPQSRVMFNYVRSDVVSGGVTALDAGTLSIYQLRFQIDF